MKLLSYNFLQCLLRSLKELEAQVNVDILVLAKSLKLLLKTLT